jgi:UDP-glucuronate 4-epimerase
MELRGKRIVVIGATGQVGTPVAKALAADNEVIGAARFADPAVRSSLEAAGVTCARVDLRAGDLAELPRDGVDVVLNFAVSKSGKWPVDLRITAESPGDVMAWCRPERFLHCSTTGVYAPVGHELITEKGALCDNHAAILPTYSISKVAAEAVVRFAARQFEVPAVIARLGVPYGDNGGWPLFHLLMLRAGAPVDVHTDAPSVYRPIHEDDIVRSLPALLGAADTAPPTFNWGGPQAVSIEEWCAYLGEITATDVQLNATDQTIESVNVDTSALDELLTQAGLDADFVDWREGMRRMVAAHDPTLLVG